jgi:phenylpyruvate tautomerase PptA (4-oxalocrotonate tautomerase family)
MTIMRVSTAGIELQPDTRANLAKRLIKEFATVEVGYFSETIAAGFTVLIEDIETDNVWMGLFPVHIHPSGKAVVITAQVMAGPWTNEMKKAIVSNLDKAVREVLEIESTGAGTNVWITITEIPEGSFGVNGRVVSIADLSQFFSKDRQQRISDYLSGH